MFPAVGSTPYLQIGLLGELRLALIHDLPEALAGDVFVIADHIR
ncbi:MAG: HD domain-containing protein [Alphaproteobacteria bacterium]